MLRKRKMRVFVTGGAGFIGRPLVKELIDHGHHVLGLARSSGSADVLRKAGAEVHHGSLEDIESLKSGARATDGVIHLAFIHDFQNFENSSAVDRAAIAAMADAMEGTGKPLVIASGTLGTSTGRIATEETVAERDHPMGHRYSAADLVYAISREKGVRGSVVRLSPIVHGEDDWAFLPMFINISRKNGVASFIGDGSARWPSIHKIDAAALFRLAVEKTTYGSTYHAVAENGIPIRDIMTSIAKHLKIPVESLSPEEAAEKMGLMGQLISMDTPFSSEKTQKDLGWTPSQIGLLDDLDKHYFL